MCPVSALQTICLSVLLCGTATSSHLLFHPQIVRQNQRNQVFALTLCLLLSHLSVSLRLFIFVCVLLHLTCNCYSSSLGMQSYLFCCSLRNLVCTDSLRTLHSAVLTHSNLLTLCLLSSRSQCFLCNFSSVTLPFWCKLSTLRLPLPLFPSPAQRLPLVSSFLWLI